MERPATQRAFDLDLIRAIALGCILVVHFNAAVTGYFTLPHKLFASVLPFGIYLGDLGSSLFFMVSGAALALTATPDQSPLAFYRRRSKAVYPLFWLAWASCFAVRFVARPGAFAGAKTPTLLLTVLGIDQFAQAGGWVAQDFACVGEWFLGSILFLYLLFPWLQRALHKNLWLTWAVALLLSVPVHCMGWDAKLVAVHLPEFLFGMCTLRLRGKAKAACAAVLGLAAVLLRQVDAKLFCAAVSALVFLVLSMLAPRLDCTLLRRFCAWLARYSYPVFLLHHVIVLRLAACFDLAALSRRDTAFLFAIYLAASFVAAQGLLWAYRKLQTALAAGCKAAS